MTLPSGQYIVSRPEISSPKKPIFKVSPDIETLCKFIRFAVGRHHSGRSRPVHSDLGKEEVHRISDGPLERYDHLFPRWKDASSSLKSAFSVLSMEQIGLETFGLSINFGPNRLRAWEATQSSLPTAIGKTIRKALLKGLGYAHFWFCLDITPFKPNDPNSGRIHLHGCLGVMPGDKEKARQSLKSVDWDCEKRAVHLGMVRSVISLVIYCHRNTLDVVRAGYSRTYHSTRTATAMARKYYQETPKIYALARAINHDRKRLSVEQIRVLIEDDISSDAMDALIGEIMGEIALPDERDHAH